MDPKTRKFLSKLGFDIQVPIRRMMGKGVDTLVDRVKEEDRLAVEELIKSAAERGDGLSKDQFNTRQDMDRFLALGFNFCFKDMGHNGRIYGYVNVYDSPLCRSTRAVMHAGYGILDPSYQALGVGPEVMSLLTMTGIALGYHGCVMRATLVSSAGLINVKRMDGPVVSGVIPNSLYLGRGRYLEDAILVASYDMFSGLQDFIETKNALTELPNLKPEIITHFNSDGSEEANTFFHKLTNETVQQDVMNGELCVFQLAGDKALLVEELFRKAADQGLGFGVDEFDHNGCFNRKFLRFSVTLVALRKDDMAFVGGMIIGPTAVARAPQAPSLCGYIVVDERHKRRGYGRDMLQTLENIAMYLQYPNIMTDVLVDETLSGVRLLLGNGFFITGQLPKCAFLKNRDFTDSLLFYKYLNKAVARL